MRKRVILRPNLAFDLVVNVPQALLVTVEAMKVTSSVVTKK